MQKFDKYRGIFQVNSETFTFSCSDITLLKKTKLKMILFQPSSLLILKTVPPPMVTWSCLPACTEGHTAFSKCHQVYTKYHKTCLI